MIEVSNLCKSFGQITAVDGISFAIARGETFGLLGPNGAGKTTTLHMLVGALSADGGSMVIAGSNDPTAPAARRNIGFAPQQVSLYDELTGLENLRFFGKLYRLRGATLAERVDWALKFAGLSQRSHDRVKTYSGGMQRRLNLACAVLHQPDVLFLDEPTAGVDPQSRNRLFENIEKLRVAGTTIVYTTHYMEEAERLCDRVAIMDHGKLLAVDTVANLIAEHGGDSLVTAELERPPDDATSLPGTLEGSALRFQSTTPLVEIGRLSDRGLRFRTLHVDQPDLETVFLNLTGRSLRD